MSILLHYTKCTFQIVSIAHKHEFFPDIHILLSDDFLTESSMSYNMLHVTLIMKFYLVLLNYTELT